VVAGANNQTNIWKWCGRVIVRTERITHKARRRGYHQKESRFVGVVECSLEAQQWRRAGFFLLHAFAVAGARTESRFFFETGLLVSVVCVPLKA
jgi:hypothetical protein